MNKQIIKMAKDLCHARDCHIKDEPTECYHGCKAWVYAERAVNKGYRKSTDVARKIFEELETVLYKIAKPVIRADGILETKIMDGFHIRIEDYNAIRKKYESEGADDESVDG